MPAGLHKLRETRCSHCRRSFITRRRATCSSECFVAVRRKFISQGRNCRAEHVSSCTREKLSLAALGKPQRAPKTKKNSPINARAIHTWIRNPSNQVFRIDNLHRFIRFNPNLFSHEDVIWKPWSRGEGSTPTVACRASRGLRDVCCGRSGTWKGWTLAATSRVSPPGTDLLQRVVVAT